ncbi:hypothetical protein [Corynebacterium sp. MC3]|uniref:hypothetical protein n=1 Tax=Corynebacterium sp. MC3 TaxID=1720193 RepID=UPI002100F1FA|nr:hypothetical protein [Corynebacterium sp. MC3]
MRGTVGTALRLVRVHRSPREWAVRLKGRQRQHYQHAQPHRVARIRLDGQPRNQQCADARGPRLDCRRGGLRARGLSPRLARIRRGLRGLLYQRVALTSDGVLHPVVQHRVELQRESVFCLDQEGVARSARR